MAEATARFALPYIQPGQAQKEVFHNEALARIDLALHPAVEGPAIDTPPGAPLIGQCWIVGTAPQSDWAGRAGAIAAWTESGWRFLSPQPGTSAWSKADDHWLHWTGSAWSALLPAAGLAVDGEQVVGSRGAAIATPSGGTTIDAEARAAVGQIIAALMSHGLID